MELSEILNIVFGTGLVATVVGLLSIGSELRKARAEARRAEADADTVKITNTEQATRILIENIVEPLREELDATRKELNSVKREVARFRKAVEAIPLCPYHGECPVLGELQIGEECDGRGLFVNRQSRASPQSGRKGKQPDGPRQHGRGQRDASSAGLGPSARGRELHGPSGHGQGDGHAEGREPGAGGREPEHGREQPDGGDHAGGQLDGAEPGDE